MTSASIHPSAYIGGDVSLAENVYIGPNCHIAGFTKIAAGSRLISGVTLMGDVHIGAGCVIEPNVSLTAVLASPEQQAKPLVIGAGTKIGSGSVLSCGVLIGPNVQIGAGTVVTRNVPAYAIVLGNPATIVGYGTPPAQARTELLRLSQEDANEATISSTVAGVRVLKFPRIRDLRGDLSAGEFGRNIPFMPKRYFLYLMCQAPKLGESMPIGNVSNFWFVSVDVCP